MLSMYSVKCRVFNRLRSGVKLAIFDCNRDMTAQIQTTRTLFQKVLCKLNFQHEVGGIFTVNTDVLHGACFLGIPHSIMPYECQTVYT